MNAKNSNANSSQKNTIDKKTLIYYSGLRSMISDGKKYGIGNFKQNIKLNQAPQFNIVYLPSWLDYIELYSEEKITAKEAIIGIDNWLYEAIKKLDLINWEMIIDSLGRNHIFHLVENLNHLMSDEDYWMITGRCYTNSDFAFEDSGYIESFLLAERSKREFLMNEEERIFFNSLPKNVTIYRGCSMQEINSGKFRFSWTLNKDVADFFAHKYSRNSLIKSKIVQKTVSKSKLIAYFNDRDEEEVLYIS